MLTVADVLLTEAYIHILKCVLVYYEYLLLETFTNDFYNDLPTYIHTCIYTPITYIYIYYMSDIYCLDR